MIVKPTPILPPSKVVVGKDGKVIRVDEWCLWNTKPWLTIQIGQQTDSARLADGEFFSHIGDPEHGGGSSFGSLPEVMMGLHPNVQARYTELFSLVNPDQEALKKLGFDRYEVESLPA